MIRDRRVDRNDGLPIMVQRRIIHHHDMTLDPVSRPTIKGRSIRSEGKRAHWEVRHGCGCRGLRLLERVAGGGGVVFLLNVEGEKNRDGGGVGVELKESVSSPDWGFWQAELTTP